MGKRKKTPSKSSQPSSIKSQEMTEANALKLTRCHTDEYDSQLQQKVDAVKALIPQAKSAAWEVHASPKTAFRLRCNFQVWHEAEGEKLHYVMYDGDNEKRTPLRVVDFPRGCAETQRLMPLVLDALRKDDVLRDKCHEVRFHTTLRGSSVVVLVYNRPIDNDKTWRTKAEKLAKTLKVVLVGRSSKFRVTLNGDAPRVREKLHIAGKDVNLYQLEGEFSQPNGRVCEKMVTWAARGGVSISRVPHNAVDAGRANKRRKKRPPRALLRQRQLHHTYVEKLSQSPRDGGEQGEHGVRPREPHC